MPRLSDDEIRAILARAEEATRGPWHTNKALLMVFAERREGDPQDGSGDRPIARMPIEPEIGIYGNREADADFVAASRTDVPALCADLLEARAERDAERDFRRELIEQHRAQVADLEEKRVGERKHIAEQLTELAKHDIATERARAEQVEAERDRRLAQAIAWRSQCEAAYRSRDAALEALREIVYFSKRFGDTQMLLKAIQAADALLAESGEGRAE
jgi:hypothetical protein